MNTTQTPTTTTTESLPKSGERRRCSYLLTGLVIFAATVALFYIEENWRGRRDWENCKRELEAKGAKLDWAYYIPPPVPDEQNSFGVPEMQEGFEGRGMRQFPGRLNYPGYHAGTNEGLLNYPGFEADTNSIRIEIAKVIIGLPGAIPPGGYAELQWSDARTAKEEAARLIYEALGPMAADPSGFTFIVKKPEEVRPALIFLACPTSPTSKELSEFFPSFFSPKPDWHWLSDGVQVDPAGSNSYRVTMNAPLSAADYVAWGATIEPKLAIIRQAVQRPYARMAGDYGSPLNIPLPNFVSLRTVSQRLAALAECYMVLGQPEKALQELTFMHQLRRLLEGRPTGRPMTLVAAMINVAITELYVETIQDGLRRQEWQEPQLKILQAQLKEVDLRKYVVDAFASEQAAMFASAEMTPTTDMGWWLKEASDTGGLAEKLFYRSIPRGWYYQNMVFLANLQQKVRDRLPSADRLVEPSKLDAIGPMIERELAYPSPFKMAARIAIPDAARAVFTMAHNQTMVNQAQIVCALERYRLSHGEYPASLDALVPQFMDRIPPDLIGGQPPHYRRTDDGKFLLYSIGWTEKDHGGESGSKEKEGDWVWGGE
jgi:hypothetical protein